MRRLKGIRWFFVALLITGSASADVIIDNSVILGADIDLIVVGPVSGDIFITTKAGNYTVTPGDAEPPAPDAVAITSFVASPSSILVGETTEISWKTQNATECAASGGVNGWASTSVALNGSESFRIDTAQSYRFTLTCKGPSGPVEKPLTVVVEDPAPAPAPTTNCPTPSLAGTKVKWDAFWNDAFPNPVYSNVNVDIPRRGYYAIEFNTSDAVDTGQLVSVELTTTSGVRIGSISECPGDFDVSTECKYTWGVGGGIIWSTNNYPRSCALKPDTTYYFNITYTDGVSSSTSQCLGDKCVTRLRAINPK